MSNLLTLQITKHKKHKSNYVFKNVNVNLIFKDSIDLLKEHHCDYNLLMLLLKKKSDTSIAEEQLKKFLESRCIIYLPKKKEFIRLNYFFDFLIYCNSNIEQKVRINNLLKKETKSILNIFLLLFEIVSIIPQSLKETTCIISDLQNIIQLFFQITFLYDLMISVYLTSINDNFIKSLMLTIPQLTEKRDLRIKNFFLAIRMFAKNYVFFAKSMKKLEKNMKAMLLLREYFLTHFCYLDRMSATIKVKYNDHYRYSSYVEWVNNITKE